MNLAFDLPNSKKERDDNPLQLYKIVSLWEVLDFYAEKFSNICRMLTLLSTTINIAQAHGTQLKPMGRLSEPHLEELRWLQDILVRLQMRGPTASAERLLSDLQRQKIIGNNQLRHDCDELMQGIIDEFKGQPILAISAHRADFYKKEGTILGKELIDKFQEFTRDAIEAGDCYALGRYTACVFHLSRLLESSIQKLATDLNATKDGQPIDVKNEEWFQIEVAIGKVINNMPRGENKTKYSKAHSSLSAIRGGWRNPTMHPAEWYSDEEAETLIKFTKQFLNDFSKLPPP